MSSSEAFTGGAAGTGTTHAHELQGALSACGEGVGQYEGGAPHQLPPSCPGTLGNSPSPPLPLLSTDAGATPEMSSSEPVTGGAAGGAAGRVIRGAGVL